ncbi:MAG TPA: methylated-DNA--[protein]-cysteine S-methyltransferase [Casimicrobiaceae bacterium]|nr:methylated-DNA--[protein]-cysteine S-methyltransferase [Casimicrobiaceae bacterium]
MTAPAYAAKLRTPFAVLGIDTDDHAVTGIRYLPLSERAQPPRNAMARAAVDQIRNYLDDPAFRFALPLASDGTGFQQRVWEAIAAVPLGESRTYAEIARTVRSSARAVGGACGANRIALVIPCHRVVGSRGALGGFMNARDGHGIAIKRWLLTHEGYRFGA